MPEIPKVRLYRLHLDLHLGLAGIALTLEPCKGQCFWARLLQGQGFSSLAYLCDALGEVAMVKGGGVAAAVVVVVLLPPPLLL